MNTPSVPILSIQTTPEIVRTFVDEYFKAWQGTDVNKILAYFSDDVVLHLPTGTMDGKDAVRDNFVRPFITGFPGNVHVPVNLAHARNLVAVEWNFEATHEGPFAGLPATGKQVKVPGCSMYEYDLDRRVITSGRIYFDLAILCAAIDCAF